MLRLTALSILSLLITSPGHAERGPGATHAAAPTTPVARIEPGTGSPGAWTLTATVSQRHDDNILQLPQRDLDRLATSPLPPRFLVKSPDDDIMEFDLGGSRRLRLAPRRETRLQASAEVNRFRRNAVKDWEQYELAVQQELTASRRSLSTFRFWWNMLPRYYLGEITDSDDSFAAGQRIRRSLTFSQSGVGLRLTQRLPASTMLAVGWELLHRDYDSHFDERDNHNAQWRIEAGVQPFRRWGMTAGVTYLTGRLDARGDLATSPIRDTDISYDHHGLGAEIVLPWGRGPYRGRVQASWMPQARRYTTTDKFDLNRFGRVNHRLATDVRVSQRVWGPLDAIITYDHLTSDASFPEGIVFDADETDFQQTRWGLMLRGRWEVPR